MKTHLEDAEVHIYAMKSNLDYRGFFARPADPAYGLSSPRFRWSTAFASDGLDNTAVMSGSIVHELGHQLNVNAYGDPANTQAFINVANQDLNVFNGALCDTVVDLDRRNNGLDQLCPTYKTDDSVLNSDVLNHRLEMRANDEYWCRAFAVSIYNRVSNPTIVNLPQYYLDLQARMPRQNEYMDLLVAADS